MYVKLLFRIPKRYYVKALNKYGNLVDVIAETLRKFNVSVREISVDRRHAKFLISVPAQIHYEYQGKGKPLETIIENMLIEKLKLKPSGIYVFPFKPKYITQYVKKKYQSIAIWKPLYDKILKYSKEKNMTINEFIQYLISLYEQLKAPTINSLR